EPELVVEVVGGGLAADVADGQLVDHLPLAAADRGGGDQRLVEGRLARSDARVVLPDEAVPGGGRDVAERPGDGAGAGRAGVGVWHVDSGQVDPVTDRDHVGVHLRPAGGAGDRLVG